MVLTFTLLSLLPAFCVFYLLCLSEPVLPSLPDAHMFSAVNTSCCLEVSDGLRIKEAEAKFSVFIKRH